jgi:hypothetical protein
VNRTTGPIDQSSENHRQKYEVSVMSRAKCNLLIAFATVVPLVALSSSGASAFGHGGFGFHPGFGGYGALPYDGYGAPGPAYVAAPSVYEPWHAAKTKEKSKNKEVKLHQHHSWHAAAAVERSFRPPAVFHAASAPAATAAPLAGACLTKEYLTDRSVVFKDNCTKETASASGPPPAAASSPPTLRATQSIRLEPVTLQDDLPQQMDGP